MGILTGKGGSINLEQVYYMYIPVHNVHVHIFISVFMNSLVTILLFIYVHVHVHVHVHVYATVLIDYSHPYECLHCYIQYQS